MRLTPLLVAGLAGITALPALGAGPVGLDAVNAWLRGIVGAPAEATPQADTNAAAQPANPTTPATRRAEPRQPTAARPASVAAASAPLDDAAAGDPAAADAADATGAVVSPAAAPLRGRQAERDRPNAAVAAIGPQRRLDDDPQAESDEPFQAQPYRLGSLLLRPVLDAAAGHTGNMAGRAGSAGGTLYRLRGEATVASDWSRHAFEATLRGGYDGYPSEKDLNTPSYDVAAHLRLDLMEETHADLALRLASARGKASAAENPAGTAVPSTTTTTGASLGLTREAGLVGLTLRGDVDRTAYSGGRLDDGLPITSDAARDNTRLAVAARASLTGAAAIRPYVEAQVIRRSYDNAAMRGRDSHGVAGIVGARLDFGPLVSGDVAAGWTREMLTDTSLPDLDGALLDAALLWSPGRLTQVALTARTTVEPTTLDGSPGALGHRLGIETRYAAARDVVATVGLAAEERRYVGVDLKERTLSGATELAWRFDRHAEVYGRAEWSRFSTTTPGAGYGNVTVMTGLRLR
jgi:hypothetical protein